MTCNIYDGFHRIFYSQNFGGNFMNNPGISGAHMPNNPFAPTPQQNPMMLILLMMMLSPGGFGGDNMMMMLLLMMMM